MPEPVLIVFSGLPGVGKSTIARALAKEIGAVWLRIDTIEQAVRAARVLRSSIDDGGYLAAQAVAADNLAIGRTVVADCVNPWMLTRDAWRDVGTGAGARVVEIEVVCSDVEEHRRRAEDRPAEVPGLVLPDWRKIVAHDYHPWERSRVRLDSAVQSVEAAIARIRAEL